MNIKERVIKKQVEIMGRKFVVEKMNALKGSYVAFQILTKTLPMGLAAKTGISLPSGNQSMSMSEFIELQTSLLSCIKETLRGGDTKILDEGGNFGVEELENNAPLLMRLTIESIVFNFSDFFEGALWKDLLPPQLSMILSGLLTSMNFSMPRSQEDSGDSTNSGTAPTT